MQGQPVQICSILSPCAASHRIDRKGSLALKKPAKAIIGGLIILAVTISGITGGLLWLSRRRWGCHGTLYFNDSGEFHGGFEMAAQWNVTLSIIWDWGDRGAGMLFVTSDPGQLGNDALERWIYTVNGFHFWVESESCVMALDGHPVVLRLVENDTVWNQFHHQYIAATPDLDPTIFPGLLSHYYVELRLAPAYA